MTVYWTDDWLESHFFDTWHGSIRHSPAFGWMAFEKTHWQPNATAPYGALRSLIIGLEEEDKRYLETADEAAQKTWRRNRDRYLTQTKIDALVKMARFDERFQVDEHQFDPDQWLLNTPTGIVNLRTGRLETWCRPDRWCSLLTTGKFLDIADEVDVAAAAANPREPQDIDFSMVATRWIDFIDSITANDPEMHQTLQLATGSCLVGENPERVIFLLEGQGANGKSVFVDTITHVLGSYATHLSPETFASRKQHENNDLARAVGKRCVASSESSSGAYLDEPLIKAFTGDETVTARRLYHDTFSFKPHFKVLFATNNAPKLRHVDKAIKARIRYLPFRVTIPIEKQDFKLREKLRAEADGILMWLIQGCLMWQRNGYKIHLAPTAVQAGSEYIHGEDIIEQFVEACIDDMRDSGAGREYSIKGSDLYSCYRSWCDQNGHRKANNGDFSTVLKSKGFSPGYHTRTGNHWTGITFSQIGSEILNTAKNPKLL